MFTIGWLPEAQADLQRIYEFLAVSNLTAAVRAVQTIYEAANSLSTSPQRCPCLRSNPARRKLRVFFGKRGYSIHFQIEGNSVYILQIYPGGENQPL
jgi:plasmid stabilization system protein ParE